MVISILISLIILCLVVGVIFWLLTMLPVPQPFLNVIKVCIVLICLIWLLTMLGGYTHPLFVIR
jgi:hypothetical protein